MNCKIHLTTVHHMFIVLLISSTSVLEVITSVLEHVMSSGQMCLIRTVYDACHRGSGGYDDRKSYSRQECYRTNSRHFATYRPDALSCLTACQGGLHVQLSHKHVCAQCLDHPTSEIRR